MNPTAHFIPIVFASLFLSWSPAGAQPQVLSESDMLGIRTAFEAGRHVAFRVEGEHHARNPGQQWLARFDGLGFLVEPDASGWRWGLELRRYGFEGGERVVSRPQSVRAEGARVAYGWDGTLEEWYLNDARGLEHGYVVRRRPGAGEGLLSFELLVRGGLVPEIEADGRGVRFVDECGALVLRYSGLIVADADGRELDARFDADREGLVLRVDERGARYPLTIDPVAQQALLVASNAHPLDYFGDEVAVSGDTVVVGAFQEDSSATGVNGDQSDNGASDSGAAYVFVRNGTTWTQQAYLKASNTGAGDNFGRSVAISGDTIVVGAWLEDSGATGVDGNQGDNSAGASGAAYIFVRNGGTWSQQAYLKASNTDPSDRFGFSVAASGNTVVVGAFGEQSNATGVNGNQGDDSLTDSGAAYVFVRNGATWSQQAYLKASNTGDSDVFGFVVAADGNTVVVGAYQEDGSATGVNGDANDEGAADAGAAYVFFRNGSTWSQQAYLKASNTGIGDWFGIGVAVSGNTVVIGAPHEDSHATGVNGDQTGSGAPDSGAAYVFVRSGATWSQQVYLKASNTGPVDAFGWSVAVSGDVALVGAPFEDSNANGVDGDGTNDMLANSGAAYAFTRGGTTWSQHAYLKASNPAAGADFGYSVSVSGATAVAGAYLAGAAYVFDLDLPPVATAHCFGDGSIVACPCSNTGASGRGCNNSSGTGGAHLTATGSTNPDTIVLTVTGEKPVALTIFLQGTASIAPVAYGDGLRCVHGTLKRLYTRDANNGIAAAPQGSDLPILMRSAQLNDPIAPGSTRHYMTYYRDGVPVYCPAPMGSTFNGSNALSIAW